MSHVSTSTKTHHPCVQSNASLLVSNESISLLALLDSGADDNFSDSNLVSQTGIPLEPLNAPEDVNTLNGKLTHRAVSLSLILSDNHCESIQPFVITSPHVPIVLGQPRLKLHSPGGAPWWLTW